METSNQPSVTSGQWCLITVRQWKREAFLKYLANAIDTKKLDELILEVVELEEPVYENMVLLRVSNYGETRTQLAQLEHFQNIQRLKPNEVSRMMS